MVIQNRQCVSKIISSNPIIKNKQFPSINYQPGSINQGNNHKLKNRINRIARRLYQEQQIKSNRYMKNMRCNTESIQKMKGIVMKRNNKMKGQCNKQHITSQKLHRMERQHTEINLFKKIRQMEQQSKKREKSLQKIFRLKQLKLTKLTKQRFANHTQQIIKDNKQPIQETYDVIKEQSCFIFDNYNKHNHKNKNKDKSVQSQKNKRILSQKLQKDITEKSGETIKCNKKNYFITNTQVQHPDKSKLNIIMYELNSILITFNIEFKSQQYYQNLPAYSCKIPKYKYYIGLGNNRKLIQQTMKKRWWWQQTQNKNSANFVWTQNQSDSILKKCEQDQKQVKNSLSNRIKCGKIQRPKFIHNHYIGNGIFGNKSQLFSSLKTYCSFKNLDISQFVPLTFHLQSEDIKSIQNFQKIYNSLKDQPWIIKPGQNSNRGLGIQITKSLHKIKARFNQLKVDESLIVQKYIKNPFLYHKRKFDVRTFMLALTIGGRTKFYWYQEGYIRTTSCIFSMNDIQDNQIHLTNDAIQVESENYQKYEQGNKLSYKDLDKYLKNSLKDQKYNMSVLNQKIKQIAIIAVKSAYTFLNKNKSSQILHSLFNFEIFGLDFMFDASLKPYLIQINTNPSLQVYCPTISRIIPHMIQNTFRMSLDSIFQPLMQYPRSLRNMIPQYFFKSNKYQPIFDSVSDRDQHYECFLTENNSIKR